MSSVQKHLFDMLQCVLLILLLWRNETHADQNKSYNISTLCARQRDIRLYKKIDGAVLTSEGEANIEECVITFQVDSILEKFMLRFETLALDCTDHLYVFEEAHAYGRPQANLSCPDTVTSVGIIFTKSNFVTLKYVTSDYILIGRGFKLIITALRTPPVNCKQFSCLNKFCIKEDLTCDGVDHCSDNSDETSHAFCVDHDPSQSDDSSDDNSAREVLGMNVSAFTVSVILLVAFGVFIAGIFMAGIGICLCRRARLQRQNLELQAQNTPTHPLTAGQQPPPSATRCTESSDRLAVKPPPYIEEGCS